MGIASSKIRACLRRDYCRYALQNRNDDDEEPSHRVYEEKKRLRAHASGQGHIWERVA